MSQAAVGAVGWRPIQLLRHSARGQSGQHDLAVNVSFANDLNVSATARLDVRGIRQQKTVGTAIVAKLQVSAGETHGCTWLKLCPATDSQSDGNTFKLNVMFS